MVSSGKGKLPVILAIALVLSMILWIVLFTKHLQAFELYKQYWIKRIGSEPDFVQWWSWGNGGLLLASAFGIFLGWVFVLKTFREKRKGRMTPLLATILLIVILVTPLFAIVAIPTSSTNPTFHILFAGDEEFMNGGQWVLWQWVPQTETAEKAFAKVAQMFQEQVGYNLVFHGWISWDSEDNLWASSEAWDMMIEAIRELNWYVGYEFDGENMDMLVAMTDQQNMVNPDHGLAFPWSQAVIVKYPGDVDTTANYIMHELGHIWTLKHHSQPGCIMDADWLLTIGLTDGFCDHCISILLENKRTVLVMPDHTYEGTTSPNGLYDVHLGTTMTITAEPDSGYFFRLWRTVEGRIISATNPLTVTINYGRSFVADFGSVGFHPPHKHVAVGDGFL